MNASEGLKSNTHSQSDASFRQSKSPRCGTMLEEKSEKKKGKERKGKERKGERPKIMKTLLHSFYGVTLGSATTFFLAS